MAAGRLPTTGSLSIVDINQYYYSSNCGVSLCGLALESERTPSETTGINDLRNCPYCQIVATPNSVILCGAEATGCACAETVRIQQIPGEQNKCVCSMPYWACWDYATTDDDKQGLKFWVNDIYDYTGTKYDTVCVYDTLTNYQSETISLCWKS